MSKGKSKGQVRIIGRLKDYMGKSNRSLRVHRKNDLHLRGRIAISLFDGTTGELVKRVESKNTITLLGRAVYEALAPGIFLQSLSLSDKNKMYVDSTGFTAVGSQNNDSSTGVALYLLDDDTPLSPDSLVLPVYGSNGLIDNDKIIGYGTISANAESSDPKEGLSEPTLGEELLNPLSQGVAFRFKEGKAVGTFNKVVIGSKIDPTQPARGFGVWKGISSTNWVYPGYTVPDARFMRPGVPNYTEADEILFINESNSDLNVGARAVLNLTTGVITGLSTSDPRYDAPLSAPDVPQVVYGTDLYFFRQTASNQGYISRLDTTTGTVTDISSALNLNNAKTLFAIDNILYYYPGSGNNLATYNMATKTAGSNKNMASQSYPTELFRATTFGGVASGCSFGKLPDGNFIIALHYLDSSASGPRGGAYVFSDLDDIAGSFVRWIPRLNSASVYQVSGQNFVFGNRVNRAMLSNWSSDVLTSPPNLAQLSLKFSPMLFGNMFHFIELEEPVEKNNDQVMVVQFSVTQDASEPTS